MDESTIYKKLFIKFKPSFLKVENESHLHSNHAQSPKSGNSHFSVTIKSEVLDKLNRIEGQRRIYDVLKEEMKNHIHALKIKILR